MIHKWVMVVIAGYMLNLGDIYFRIGYIPTPVEIFKQGLPANEVYNWIEDIKKYYSKELSSLSFVEKKFVKCPTCGEWYRKREVGVNRINNNINMRFPCGHEWLVLAEDCWVRLENIEGYKEMDFCSSIVKGKGYLGKNFVI